MTPSWPLSCPIKSNGPRDGCKIFSCPTNTPEEFYGQVEQGSSSPSSLWNFGQQMNPIGMASPTNNGTDTFVGENNSSGFNWSAFGVAMTIVGICSLCFWNCCLTNVQRHTARMRIAAARTFIVGLAQAVWSGCCSPAFAGLCRLVQAAFTWLGNQYQKVARRWRCWSARSGSCSSTRRRSCWSSRTRNATSSAAASRASASWRWQPFQSSAMASKPKVLAQPACC